MNILKISFIVIFLLIITGCAPKNTITEIKNNSDAEIKFENLTIIINNEDKICNSDEECVLFQPDCGDCEIDTININSLSRYKNAKLKYCSSINEVYVACDMIFAGKFECVNNICEITIN